MKFYITLGLLFSLALQNSEISAFEQEKYEKAEEVFMPRVKYPGGRGNHMQAGYVEIEAIIDKDGKVVYPVITRSTHGDFEKHALKAIKKYKFSPAKYDQKIVQSRFSHTVHFTAGLPSTKPKFKALYDTGFKMLESENARKKDVEQVVKKLKRTSGLAMWHLIDIAILEHKIAEKFGSIYKQKEVIQKLIAFGSSSFGGLSSKRELEYSSRLMNINGQMGRHMEVLLAFNDLQNKFSDNLMPYFQTVTDTAELIKSGKPYQQTVYLSKRGDDFLFLSGDEIYIESVKGEIKNLHFRCQAKYKKLKFNQENNYRVPKSWGNCLLQIEGKPNTEAKMVQMTAAKTN